MNHFADIKAVYFLGIGGIGMSALAKFFLLSGKIVAGYDRTPSALTESLIEQGADIHFEDNIDRIPNRFKNSSQQEILVIYTPAVPADFGEMKFFREKSYKIIKRAEALGYICSNFKTFAVSGTHGKTTVSTITAHILHSANVPINAFLGGISKNLESNLLVHPDSGICVAEADEFDRSFLQLYPHTAVVTAVDADHLDIYDSLSAVRDSFEKFTGQISRNGNLIIKKGINLKNDNFPTHTFSYSIQEKADFYAENIFANQPQPVFDLVYPGGKIEKIQLGVSGRVNVENAVAASAICLLNGVSENALKKALETFSGVRRRFDVIFDSDKKVYIDDYAHHPEELKAFIGSVKEMYRGKKVLGIFQPHLYSRTRDFAREFAQSLDLLDELLLTEIYPARELPIPGVDSQMILNQCKIKNKKLCSKNELVELIEKSDFDVLLTMGAGDIELFRDPIKNILTRKA